VVLHPDGNFAYLPLTRSNTSNQTLTFDTTVFPIVAVIDLEASEFLPKEIISLPEMDMPVGLPYDMAFSSDAGQFYIVHAASNDVSIFTGDSMFAAAHIEVGDNPRGITISQDGKQVYVNNTLAGTISVIDTTTFEISKTIAITRIPLPPALLNGKRIYHSSDIPELSREQWMSCNTCHWEGEHDGRTWFFNFAGPRNTTSLLGMLNTYPLRWSAEWDESADSEFAITQEQFGEGFLGGDMHPTLEEANAGREYDLDCLAAFIDSLVYLPNFHIDTYDPESVSLGEALFFDERVGCGECHPAPYYTDMQVHDVGTASGEGEQLGPQIDTPTLKNLTRAAPFLHDGSAATLLDVLTTANSADLHGETSHLDEGELQALVAFMMSIP
jgi:YVTN family beta-propeller protein